MSSSQLRLLAIVLMFIDHLGAYLFPNLLELRLIGRLSFPLFAWSIANGYRHTHSLKNYFLRLTALALLSQLPFYLINSFSDSNFTGLNIFFTLTLGLLAIALTDKLPNKLVAGFSVLILLLIAEITHMDYGAAGLASILIFHLFYSSVTWQLVLQILLWTSFTIFTLIASNGTQLSLNLFAIPAVLIIKFYNGLPGINHQKLTYLFYPVHLLVLYIFKILA